MSSSKSREIQNTTAGSPAGDRYGLGADSGASGAAADGVGCEWAELVKAKIIQWDM